MNKEEITCKIPNNQIHISKEKDEDCLIWISSKAINMSNTIDELQQQNQKYKEVIDKMNKLLQQEQDAMTTKFHYDIVGLINALLDILKEVS